MRGEPTRGRPAIALSGAPDTPDGMRRALRAAMKHLPFLLLAACLAPVAYVPVVTQTPDQPVEQAQPEDPGQVVMNAIAAAGYQCSATETGQAQCVPPNSVWPIYVGEVTMADGSIQFSFESWADRAFARPCSTFGLAMQDLADPDSSFTATCEDKKFRFRTLTSWGGEFDLGWLSNHEAHRYNAAVQLRRIRALSPDSARALAIN